VYLVIAVAWIAWSDRLVFALVPDPGRQYTLSTAKGFGFVALTAALLFALIRRNERGIAALGTELRATVDGMADGVLVVDAARRVVEANRAALALLGVASKDEVLLPLDAWARRFEARTPEGAPMRPKDFAASRVLGGGDPVPQYELVLRRADGRDVFVSVSASRVGRPGHPALAVSVLRDVTAARRLDEAREEFLSTAAHELKTPLAVIKAYAQLMARREPAEHHALEVIDRQVDRMSRLVEQLLDASRLRAQEDAGPVQPFDLAALAREVVERVRPSAPAHALAVEADGPAAVLADRGRIERVLASLLDNAIRFSPGGGPVRLRIERVEGEVQVSVVDQGVGIPAERQARLFERYYRAHAGRPDDYGGLGLGLEMSRDVVERHGGRMWFESEPGAGSTFHFGLPAPREDA
jgi:signal transduction histidine kinase